MNIKMSKILLTCLLAIIAVLLLKLRPFIFIIIPVSLLLYSFENIKSLKLRIVLAILLGMLLMIIVFSYGGTNNAMIRMENRTEIVKSNTNRQELASVLYEKNHIKRLMIGSIRFVIFPSPFNYINVLLGDDDSGEIAKNDTYSGVISSILKLQASLFWVFFLPLILLGILTNKEKININIFIIYLLALFYIFIYGYYYMGASEVRQKIIVYIAGVIMGVSYLQKIKKEYLSVYLPIVSIIIVLIYIGWFIRS